MVSYCGGGMRVGVNASTQDVQRRISELLELESEVVVSWSVWMLATEPWSSGQIHFVLGVLMYTFSPSFEEAEAGRSLWVQGWIDLHSKGQVSQGCIVRLCFKINKLQKFSLYYICLLYNLWLLFSSQSSSELLRVLSVYFLWHFRI